METIKKFFAKLKPIQAVQVACLILTVIGLIEVLTLKANPFLVWLMGLLNGMLLIMIWLEDNNG